MLVYSFLRRGAVGRLSGLGWPLPADGGPGDWIEAAPGSDAVRGCRGDDLPYWIDDELWEVELAGELTERDHLLVAQRGRLVRLVAGWDAACADAFTDDCAVRAQRHAVAALRAGGLEREAGELDSCDTLTRLEHVAARIAGHDPSGALLAGLAADVVMYARDAGFGPTGAAVAGYVAAHALGGGDRGARGYEERFAAERARQAAWLRSRLGA